MNPYQVPLFEGMSEEALGEALQRFRRLDVVAGVTLIEEGEEDSTLVCVLAGRLRIETGDTELGFAGPGDIVGEMALFGAGQRQASVVCEVDATVLVLDREGYEALRSLDSPVAHALERFVLDGLLARLSDVSERIGNLADGQEPDAVTPPKGFLERVREAFGSGGTAWVVREGAGRRLEGNTLFEGVPADILGRLARHMVLKGWPAGSFLCTQGTLGKEMFILVEGRVEVLVDAGEGRVQHAATLAPGDAFGMTALLHGRPRTASCVASGRALAFEIAQEAWDRVVALDGPVGSALRTAMIRSVSGQLALANGQLNQLELIQQGRESGWHRLLLMARAGVEAAGQVDDVEEG